MELDAKSGYAVAMKSPRNKNKYSEGADEVWHGILCLDLRAPSLPNALLMR